MPKILKKPKTNCFDFGELIQKNKARELALLLVRFAKISLDEALSFSIDEAKEWLDVALPLEKSFSHLP